MSRLRRRMATVLLCAAFLIPLPGCVAPPGGGGALGKLVLGVGASVGTYFLIKAIED